MFKTVIDNFREALLKTPNLAYFLVGMTNRAALTCSPPGFAKTAFLQVLAAMQGYKYYRFIPSLHLPEDLSGIPVKNMEKMFVEMMPMEFVAACQEPNWMFFFDEVNVGKPEMRPPMLSLLQEAEIGSIKWHPTTQRFAACNPDNWAPQASDLEASLSNRMFHCEWEFPMDSYRQGLKNGLEWTAEMVMKTYTLPTFDREEFELNKGITGNILDNFLQAKPDLLYAKEPPTEQGAYPSPRTWGWLAESMAAAMAARVPFNVYGDLARGWVGEQASAAFLTYLSAMDLYDPNDLIDGKKKPNLQDDRVDQLIHLPWCMLSVLEHRQRNNNLQASNIDNALEIMLDMGESNLVDCIVGPVHTIGQLDKDYEMPEKLADRWDNLIAAVYA